MGLSIAVIVIWLGYIVAAMFSDRIFETRHKVQHKYLSTACHHEHHVHCRTYCKFCRVLCECACHTVRDDEQGTP
jgi:hypothetical protein